MTVKREAGWHLYPIGGDTGKAYMGRRNEEKVFLKRNSSPFLAALSIEGITPKLIWTKRIENGDVLTAQEWCNGRTLSDDEMSSRAVADILSQVHQSQTLRRILNRVSGDIFSAADFLEGYYYNLAPELENHEILRIVFEDLVEDLDQVENTAQIRACHGDISHDNFLLSDQDKLFLVDWDSVMLADSASDIGQLFARYIDINDWDSWYQKQIIPINQVYKNRIRWYAFVHMLADIKRAYHEKRYNRMNYLLLKIHRWLHTDK